MAGAKTAKGSDVRIAAATRAKVDRNYVHDKKNFLRRKQDAQRARAVQMRLEGKARAQHKIVQLPKGDFVQLDREGTDRIFVVIAEFGDARHPSYPDVNVDGTPASDAQRFDGPRHNQIPEPDRSVDNTTLWQKNYNPAHYQDMYFNRMAKYYESQSSNRYSVAGDVSAWVEVPFNEARYGRNICGGIVCSNTWFLIRDALAFWVQGQKSTGKSDAQIAD